MLQAPRFTFDHIAVAARDMEPAYEAWRLRHGAGRVTGSSSDRHPFVSRQLTFAEKSKLELICPSPDPERSFIDDFIDRFGENLHHLTFKVDDFELALTWFERHGISLVDVSRARPEWLEAFVSPKLTGGPIVQIASSDWSDERFASHWGHPVVDPAPCASWLHGAVIEHADMDAAARFWPLTGAEVQGSQRGLACRWPGSRLQLWVRSIGSQTGLVLTDGPDPGPDPDPTQGWAIHT